MPLLEMNSMRRTLRITEKNGQRQRKEVITRCHNGDCTTEVIEGDPVEETTKALDRDMERETSKALDGKVAGAESGASSLDVLTPRASAARVADAAAQEKRGFEAGEVSGLSSGSTGGSQTGVEGVEAAAAAVKRALRQDPETPEAFTPKVAATRRATRERKSTRPFGVAGKAPAAGAGETGGEARHRQGDVPTTRTEEAEGANPADVRQGGVVAEGGEHPLSKLSGSPESVVRTIVIKEVNGRREELEVIERCRDGKCSKEVRRTTPDGKTKRSTAEYMLE